MYAESSFTLRIGSWKAGIDISEARLRVERVNTADLGKIREGERVDMNRMVIPEINLDSSEDLVVNKVKRRPAVLISKNCYNMRKFAAYESGQRADSPPGANRLIFAPIYSLSKEDHSGSDYPRPFIDKVSAGSYPNIMFLPAYGTVMRNDSMLVLSEMFSVQVKCADLTEYCIDPLTFGMKLSEFDEFVMLQAEELQTILEESASG